MIIMKENIRNKYKQENVEGAHTKHQEMLDAAINSGGDINIIFFFATATKS